MIVLQLGELRLKSEQNQIRFEQTEELEFEQLKAKAYDIYSLEMEKLQIMAALPGDNWKERLEAGDLDPGFESMGAKTVVPYIFQPLIVMKHVFKCVLSSL